MKRALVFWLFSCSVAQAITWNFDQEGATQGWYARESHASFAGSDLLPLATEVSDGVLRVQLRPYEVRVNPTALLVSPAFQLDSRLFDRVALRVRLVHTRPVVGRVLLSWTNQHNRTTPGVDPDFDPTDDKQLDRFEYVPPPGQVTFTTEWQEISIGGFSEASELVWADTLIDVRVDFLLAEVSVAAPGISGPEEAPEALEIDWIRLTGVEEQLQGELPPPPSPPRPVPGGLFAPAEFQALSFPGLVRPILGDLDGDGDLDMVVSSEFNVPGKSYRNKVWTVAYNDGRGYFRQGQWRRSAEEIDDPTGPGGIASFAAVDLNKDRYTDLVLIMGQVTEAWLNDREGGFLQTARITERAARAVADVDGDGDPDLLFYWPSYVVSLSDGQGHFGEPQEIGLREPEPQGRSWVIIDAGIVNSEGLNMLLWQRVVPGPLTTFMVTSATFPEVEERQRFEVPVTYRDLLYIGDIDNDGSVDLGTTKALQNEGTGGNQSYGLLALLSRGDGEIEPQAWLPQGVLVRDPSGHDLHLESKRLRTWDLDGDGVQDQVFLDMNPRIGRNALVLLGRKGAMPVLEGQYALQGKIGVEDAGDIDGDGDLDLVIGTSYGGGGLGVLRNLRAERITAVAEEVGGQVPASFQLGANYPNPFNPTTVIPFTLPQAGSVRVEVYDLLGRRVRALVAGVQEAGVYRVEWDGRDEGGEEVGSGVYVCRVQARKQVLTHKMVKVE